MIRTSRLMLLPLTYAQEMLYLEDNGLLEKDLGLHFTVPKLPAELKQVISRFILPLFLQQPENAFFFTSWIAVDLDLRTIVADLAFKGKPEGGSVEVGYGTYEGYKRKGYMTEALNGLVGWACQQPEILEVTAETARFNTSSIRVLQKSGFELINNTPEYFYWSHSCV